MELKELEAKYKELWEEIEKLKSFNKKGRVNKWETYYFINSCLEAIQEIETENIEDEKRWEYWNYYKTKEEVAQIRDRQLAIVRVNNRIKELNEWFVFNENVEKYNIYHYKKFYINEDFLYKTSSIINPCKTYNIAQQIISEMKDDLNLIFNIK